MYLKMPSGNEYQAVYPVLMDMFADRILQVGDLDMAVVGQLAIHLLTGQSSTDVLDKIEVVYSLPQPPMNHEWLTATKTKWLPRHIHAANVTFTQDSKRFAMSIPVMKLSRMRKLYKSPPISNQHFEYLLKIEKELEKERLSK